MKEFKNMFGEKFSFRNETKDKLFLIFPTIAFKRVEDYTEDKINYQMYYGWLYFHGAIIIFQKEMY